LDNTTGVFMNNKLEGLDLYGTTKEGRKFYEWLNKKVLDKTTQKQTTK